MLGDGIKQTTTSTGTGNLTLAAVTGFPQFADQFTVGANGAPFYYSILDGNGGLVEQGIGHLLDAATLVRDRVLASYSGGVYVKNSPSQVSLAAGTYSVLSSPELGALMTTAPYVSNNASLGLGKRVVSMHMTVGNAASAAVTLAANKLHLVPFLLGTNMECNALIARVGTGVSATNIRLGLYRCGSDGFPSELIAQTVALASATSGVDVSGSITPVRLAPGWYFTAIVSDGAPVVGRLDGGTHLTNPLGQASSNCMIEVPGFSVTSAFGALPSPAPSTSLAALTATGLPAVILGAV